MEPIDGCDHLCMSLCIVVFSYWWCFWFYIFFVVGGVGYVFMCDLIGEVLFWFCVLPCVYVCLFCVLSISFVHCGFSAPNKDIMRFRCGDGKSYALLRIFF